MTVSSRTPEGMPSHCPLCGTESNISFSDPAGDAPCPNCGCLIWQSMVLLEQFRDRWGSLLADFSAESPLREIAKDSLDVVELVMELEEEFDINIPDDEAEKIKTIGDLIRFLEKWRRERGQS